MSTKHVLKFKWIVQPRSEPFILIFLASATQHTTLFVSFSSSAMPPSKKKRRTETSVAVTEITEEQKREYGLGTDDEEERSSSEEVEDKDSEDEDEDGDGEGSSSNNKTTGIKRKYRTSRTKLSKVASKKRTKEDRRRRIVSLTEWREKAKKINVRMRTMTGLILLYNSGEHDLLCKDDPRKPRALEAGFKSDSHLHRAMNEYHDHDRRTYVASWDTTKTTVKKGKGRGRKKKTVVKLKSCSQNVVPARPGFLREGARKSTVLPQPKHRADHMVFRCPEDKCEFCLNVLGRTGDGGFDVYYFHEHTCSKNNNSFRQCGGNMKGSHTNYSNKQLAGTIAHEFIGKTNKEINTNLIDTFLNGKVIPAKHNAKKKTKKSRVGGIKHIKQAVSMEYLVWWWLFVVFIVLVVLIEPQLSFPCLCISDKRNPQWKSRGKFRQIG